MAEASPYGRTDPKSKTFYSTQTLVCQKERSGMQNKRSAEVTETALRSGEQQKALMNRSAKSHPKSKSFIRHKPLYAIKNGPDYKTSIRTEANNEPISAKPLLTIRYIQITKRGLMKNAPIVLTRTHLINPDNATPVALQFDAQYKGGSYVATSGNREAYSRGALVALAKEGRFIGTFTARIGLEGDITKPQPALWTLGPIEKQSGTQKFPAIYPGSLSMKISGRHIRDNAHLFVDGVRAPGSLKVIGETIEISLQNLPSTGIHFLQVQNPDGLFSNDFLFHVTQSAESAQALYGNSLANILQRSEWNQILGTWVDTATQGKLLKTTYAWKIPGEVIEVTSHEPQKESISLIIAHPLTHQVTQTGANSDGTTFSTSWNFKAPGNSQLKVAYTTRDGTSGTLQINQQLKGPDSLTQTLLLTKPITIQMNHERKP